MDLGQFTSLLGSSVRAAPIASIVVPFWGLTKSILAELRWRL